MAPTRILRHRDNEAWIKRVATVDVILWAEQVTAPEPLALCER